MSTQINTRRPYDPPTAAGNYACGFSMQKLDLVCITQSASGLAIRFENGVTQQLDEADSRLLFFEIGKQGRPDLGTSKQRLVDIDHSIMCAEIARGSLATSAGFIADKLGCELGDGSPLSDAVDNLVFNGMGSLAELLRLADECAPDCESDCCDEFPDSD